MERVATAPGRTFGSCISAYRLDFSEIRRPGDYRIAVDAVVASIRIRANAYAGAADTLLYYMREQRSGYNPLFKTVVHIRDGIVVDDSARAGKFVPVTGGWADASDYLQYVMTSANATFVMLMAYRDRRTRITGAEWSSGCTRRKPTRPRVAGANVSLRLGDVQPAR